MKKKLILGLTLAMGILSLSACTNADDAPARLLKYTILEDGTYAVSGTKRKNCTKIVIPEEYKGIAVTEISNDAFSGLSALTYVSVSGNVKIIGYNAFEKCPNLTTVEIAEGVETIKAEVFSSCPSLTDITLPSSLQFVYDLGILNHDTLNDTECDGLAYLGNASNPYMILAYAAWDTEDKSITDVTVHEGCRFILLQAVNRYYYLDNITLPSTLEFMHVCSFSVCTSLLSITYPGTMEEWSKVKIMDGGSVYCHIQTVHCSDGDVVYHANYGNGGNDGWFGV